MTNPAKPHTAKEIILGPRAIAALERALPTYRPTNTLVPPYRVRVVFELEDTAPKAPAPNYDDTREEFDC